jgi:urease accessory protein
LSAAPVAAPHPLPLPASGVREAPAEREGEGGVRGVAEIGFARRGDATRLAHLYQRHPLRVLFPEPAETGCALAVLVTTSGGLVAGDRLRVSVEIAAGAAAHVTASAAEKIYRSLGPTTEIDQQLTVAPGGWLEFLPPETILFEGARLRRETRIALAPGAGFLGGDIAVFGRLARGERLTRGLFRDVREVWRGEELIWGDALHLDGDIVRTLDHPACLAGANAAGTLIFVPPAGDPRRFLADVRAVQGAVAGLAAGATIVDGVLLARWLAAEPSRLRHAYADLACHLRAAAMGLPRRLPRLWHI